MIFKSIKLKNYRQYKDVEIKFDEKINILEAGNGVGKSTLMSGLIFALYGYNAAVNSGFIKVTETPLINLDCLNENNELKNKEDKIEVKLVCVASDNTEYTITRSYCMKTDDDKVTTEKKSESTNYIQTDVSIDEVEKLLPEEFTPLLFFNGERIKKIEDSFSSKTDGFKDEIEKILKIKEYKEAKKLIRGSIKKINSEANFADPEIMEYANKIESWTNHIESRRAKVESAKLNLEKIKQEKNDIEEKLKTYEETKGLMEKREELSVEIEGLEIERNISEMKAREQILKNFPDLIKINTFEKVAKSISYDENYSNLIGIEQKAIDKIIENKKCICGTDINQEIEYKLIKLKKVLPPESFQTVLNVKLDNNEENKNNLINYINDYSYKAGDALEKLEEQKQKRRNVSKRIPEEVKQEMKKANIEKLNSSLQEKESSIENLNEDIIIWNSEIKKIENNLRDVQRKYNKKLDEEKQKEVEKAAIQMLQKAETKLKMEIENRKEQLKQHMEERVNKFANRLLFDEIEIGLDSGLRPKKIKLNNGAEELSTGQSVIVSLSYLFALMETSKEEEEFGHNEKLTENYPMILDGVTATLDELHTSKLIEHIKNNDGQVIIFANTKEKKVFDNELDENYVNIKLHKNANSNELKVVE